VFERFTDRALRAVSDAEDEARRLRQHAVGPEHLLIALASSRGAVDLDRRRTGADAGVQPEGEAGA
jgi:hypothetical protein